MRSGTKFGPSSRIRTGDVRANRARLESHYVDGGGSVTRYLFERNEDAVIERKQSRFLFALVNEVIVYYQGSFDTQRMPSPRRTAKGRGAGRGQGPRMEPEQVAADEATSLAPVEELQRDCSLESVRSGPSESVSKGAPLEPTAETQNEPGSIVSRGRTLSRKRRLELRAAEERAKIKRRAIGEREQLELELVDKQLRAELSEAESEDGSVLRSSIRSGAGKRSTSRTRHWISSSSFKKVSEAGQPTQEVRTSMPGPAVEPEVTVENTEVKQLTKALTQTLGEITARVGSTRVERTMQTILNTRDLPTFNGDPLDWLRFKRTIELLLESTDYLETEKVTRLYSCLRGEARKSVAAMMMTASTTSQVMEVLELRFGNPDYIVREFTEELKRLPKIGTGRDSLVVIATKLRNCVAAMQAVNHVGYLHSPELASEIIRKMPNAMIYNYNRYWHENRNMGDPRLLTLSKYLQLEAEIASKAGTSVMIGRQGQPFRRQNAESDRRYPAKGVRHVSLATSRETEKKRGRSKCVLCGGPPHRISECIWFAAQSIQQRWDCAKKKGLCFRCLQGMHRRNRCRAKLCQRPGCNRAHHTLLHRSTEESTAEMSEHCTPTRPDETASAPVTVTGPRGSKPSLALMDEGSTISLIDESLAEEIGAGGPREQLILQGANQTMIAVESMSKRVTFKISGALTNKEFSVSGAQTVKGLSLPWQGLSRKDLDRYTHLNDIEIQCYPNEQPQLLLGQDNWDLIISQETRRASRDEPVASRTELGWVVHGYVATEIRPRVKETMLHIDNRTDAQDDQLHGGDLHELVKNHFRLESIGIMPRTRFDAQKKRAIQLLKSTTKRVGDRWETGLLWRQDDIQLPDNYSDTFIRLKSLEKKLDKNPEYERAYQEQINDLISNGYARKSRREDNQRRWYLPHFGVTNPHKPGKLRLVFDAAARTDGVSLNDHLLAGPDMLNSLLGTLFRFRQGLIAFTGDIKEMFLQIKIRTEDQRAQCFLWRGKDRRRPPETYIMTSMIFGAASSPCSALYVRNRNAEEFRETYPHAAKAIIQKHYVDDYLDSVNTDEEAIKLIHDFTEAHRRGGFQIRNWSSNSQKVLSRLPQATLMKGAVPLNSTTGMETRILDLQWAPTDDTLGFELNMKKGLEMIVTGAQRPTKREMLRTIMSVFDPIGILAPLTIRSRMLLQKVWRSGIAWDQCLTDDRCEYWRRWTADLKAIGRCKIPRCYIKQPLHSDPELRMFCDAGERAYAAVAYWRYELENDKFVTAFIASKSRVAPLKPVSIPRMELQAALLGGRIACTIQKEHDFKVLKRVFWTDSRTVLHWIRTDPREYKAFVAHRLGEIDDLTDVSEWRWVPTRHNPADDATRDNQIQVTSESRWIVGPEFLTNPEETWPKMKSIPNMEVIHVKEERKPQFVAVCSNQFRWALPELARFSSWTRLIRSTGWVLVFADRCRRRRNSEMSVDYLERAETLWIKSSQRESFGQEIEVLRQNKTLPRHSRLVQLTVLLDEEGIIRLRRRISALEGVERQSRDPPVLDGKHAYTKLLVLHYHRRANHGSTEATINELRQKYWILNLRPTARNVAARCQLCRIKRSKPETPLMADLPAARLKHHHRPFTYCGIDYFGPMLVTIGRRREKRWGVLFTCLTTRAIHLELAASLTTDSMIMALRRMIARRGCSTEIYSDNGTNFRGADAELRIARQEMDANLLNGEAINLGIRWRFIPPAAPHMGGSWERLIRSVKVSLKAVLKERAPTEETLATLMAEVEHTVNSRPLTHVSVDHRDQGSLTPNHFLIGASSGAPIPGKFRDQDLHLRKQWRVAQKLADMYWSRWVKEYLPTLLTRTKWNRETRPLQEGDLVQIVDHTLPRNTWPRGIISKVYPGPDGRIRVVDVRTKTGILRRPAVKVVVLPITEIGASILESAPEGENVDDTEV
ncbi:uncharacterized protein LOC143187433 [Calliopsis andreniformis]|uniref:uncharacterized protein LOC143187433 n=1 Tax=Calliopsis andreniformis TaxID=337506 RepID=UPI003FCC56E6